ncbi:MAG: hypothetical protein NC102_00155 [Clostridium sp.]|nr:hypothetical protein [Clostridium sp.]
MTNLQRRPSRIDFDSIDPGQISRILKTGDISSLTEAEKDYYGLMDIVRGFCARMLMPGGNRIVTKSAIIKILKSEAYGLSDWMARRVYNDAINFFYADDGVAPRAWAGLYAERLDKLANLAASMGKLKEAKGYIVEAAKLRGCYDGDSADIPQELLETAPVVIYTSDPESMGAPKADRKELEAFIDSIPDLPEVSRRRVKEDAGISRRSLLDRMIEDARDFGDGE